MLTNIPLIINLGEAGPLTWNMAKQIIQSQHTLAIYGITAVVGLAILVVAASWLWNLYLHKRELQRAIKSLRSEITTKAKEDFAKLSERTKDDIGRIKKEIEKSVEERMVLFDAEKARLFALASAQLKDWETTAVWFAIAIEGYDKAEKEEMLRICVDALNANLAACKKLSESNKQRIKKCLPFIPEILQKEKEQIEDKLKKLPEEIKEH